MRSRTDLLPDQLSLSKCSRKNSGVRAPGATGGLNQLPFTASIGVNIPEADSGTIVQTIRSIWGSKDHQGLQNLAIWWQP